MASILDRFKEEPSGLEQINATKKLKFGIIGTGWIAEAHLRSLLRCEDIEIVAAADLIPGKAEAFFESHAPHLKDTVRYYPDHKTMLDAETLDGVCVCTYNRTHAECSIYALEKGVNVLCEKPMCVTLEEAIAMRQAEKASGKILSIGFQPRVAENMKMIKKIVQSGELGDIYYIQTGGGRRHGIPTPCGTTFIENETAGIGALGDIGCYSLDLVLNAVGYPKPLTVTGFKTNFFGTNPSYYPFNPEYAEKFGVDDFAGGFIRLEGGIMLDFRIGWAMHMNTTGDTLILGTKAGLRIPSTECWNGTLDKPMVIYRDVAGTQVETVIPLKAEKEDFFYLKLRSFANAIHTNSKAPVPTEEIIYNQAIIDGIVRSAELGREIEIDIPEI